MWVGAQEGWCGGGWVSVTGMMVWRLLAVGDGRGLCGGAVRVVVVVCGVDERVY